MLGRGRQLRDIFEKAPIDGLRTTDVSEALPK